MGEPLGGEEDEPMVDLVIDELAETIVEAEEQVIALVIDVEEDIAMLFSDYDFSDDDSEGFEDDEEVGGPSTTAVEGHSLALPTPGFLVPLSVSDTEVADGITIREIGPRVSAVEGHVQVMASQMVQVVGRLEQANVQQRDVQIRQLQNMISLPDFASVFKFNERVTNLEKDLSEIKQVDQYAQALSSIPREAQAEKRKYIDLVDSMVRTIIKEEVNTQLPQILPQAISDVATPVIEKNVTESLEVVVLTRSKEKKSSSTSKDASQSQHKSFGKSAHTEELSHIVEDSGMQQDQEFVTRDNDKQPADKEVTKADWFKKPERPPTLDSDWSKRQHVEFRPPQTWISQVARAEEPPTSFDELNDTSFC
ncbi:hypothetical protein Tco_0699018 [Tanacetum coccineum]